MMKSSAFCMVAIAGIAAAAAMAVETDPIAAFASIGRSQLWRTAPAAEFDVAVPMPDGATSATLTVAGRGYTRVFSGITGPSQRISLPVASAEDDEGLYTLTLEFDDDAHTVLSSQLATPMGAAAGGEATAVVRTMGAEAFNKVRTYALFPIPAGAAALSVNGADVGLDPAFTPGWFLFGPAAMNVMYGLILSGADGSETTASLYGASIGFCIYFK